MEDSGIMTEISLKILDSESEFHSGYGAGAGSIDKTIYECPCGKGKVIYTKDNIPGFRDRDIQCDCKECNEKYEFNKNRAIIK